MKCLESYSKHCICLIVIPHTLEITNVGKEKNFGLSWTTQILFRKSKRKGLLREKKNTKVANNNDLIMKDTFISKFSDS